MNIFWGFQDFLIYSEKYFWKNLDHFSQEKCKQNSLNSVNKNDKFVMIKIDYYS